MRKSINAKVVGQRLFVPDPKQPEKELMRIEISIQPLNEAATEKNSKGILIAPLDVAQELPIGIGLRISIEDTQQILPLARATNAARKRRERDAHPELH